MTNLAKLLPMSLAVLALCWVGLSGCDGPEVPGRDQFYDAGATDDTGAGGDLPCEIKCEDYPNRFYPCDAKGGRCYQFKCVTAEGVAKQLTEQEMVEVPAASFKMGCVPGDSMCKSNETPRIELKLDGFYVLKTEVSVRQYNECVKKGYCTPPATACPSGPQGAQTAFHNFTAAKTEGQYKDHPVNCVTWKQARDYCQNMFHGGDLPTEAQFEYLMRRGPGGADAIYPHGSSMPPPDSFANLPNGKPSDLSGAHGNTPGNQLIENYYDDAVATWPVDNKGTPIAGVYDLWGNLWEWTRDRVDSGSGLNLLEQAKEGFQDVTSGNPVIRGSGFYYTGDVTDGPDGPLFFEALRTSFRLDKLPASHYKDDLGFRCVVDLIPFEKSDCGSERRVD